MKNSSTWSQQELRAELFRRGELACFYLRPSQKDLYETIRRNKSPFIECSRRFGKTTTILVYCNEMGKRQPGIVIRICEPWKNQCREIILPEMDKIQSIAAPEDRFIYKAMDSVYIHPNGSRIYLRGVNEDRGESARGSKAHIIVADEFGSWRDPEYIVNEALRPQLLTTDGQFIFASTPSEDLGHPYYIHKGRAIQEGRFIQKTIYQCDGISEEKVEEIAKEVGGKDKAAFRREYLCEGISDPEKLVVPEFNESLHLFDDYPRPDFFDAYVGCDLGLNDQTALLFGYYDFPNATLVIEAEWIKSGKNSREITEAALAIERELWGPQKPYLRVSDNELQQLHDMSTLFDYDLYPTRKDDKPAAINQLRDRFAKGKIKIHRRCVGLTFQLKTGLWNERRTDYVRSDYGGHLDAIDALVYLNRNLVLNRNPRPVGLGVTPQTHYIDHTFKPEMVNPDSGAYFWGGCCRITLCAGFCHSLPHCLL